LLDPVKTRLEDVQQFLKDVLPSDAILCGQSLKGDLMAMQVNIQEGSIMLNESRLSEDFSDTLRQFVIFKRIFFFFFLNLIDKYITYIFKIQVLNNYMCIQINQSESQVFGSNINKKNPH